MSFLEDLRGLFRRVSLITRTNINHYRGKLDSDREADLFKEIDFIDEDDVIRAVALRNFSETYPVRSEIRASSDISEIIPLNRTSVLNMIISFASNLSFVSFAILSFVFIPILISSLLDLFLLGGHTIVMSAVDILLGATVTGTALASGLLLSELDVVVTMRKCLEKAKEDLRDRQIYHQERCLLEMQIDNDKMAKELNRYNSLIESKKKEVKTLRDMCQSVELISYLKENDKRRDLAPYRDSIKKLTNQIRNLENGLRKRNSIADELRAKLYQLTTMAKAVRVSDAIRSLRSGDSSREIKELNEITDESLKLIKDKIANVRQDIMDESGLDSDNHNKKPKLLE